MVSVFEGVAILIGFCASMVVVVSLGTSVLLGFTPLPFQACYKYMIRTMRALRRNNTPSLDSDSDDDDDDNNQDDVEKRKEQRRQRTEDEIDVLRKQVREDMNTQSTFIQEVFG